MATPMVGMTLRMSPDLHDALGRLAEQNHRSRHAEVLFRINQALKEGQQTSRPASAGGATAAEQASQA